MDFDLAKFRAEKGISLHEISTKLNIPEKFLLAIEELNFDELPAPIFAKSQIKKYCSFYDLEPSIILEKYEKFLKEKHRPLLSEWRQITNNSNRSYEDDQRAYWMQKDDIPRSNLEKQRYEEKLEEPDVLVAIRKFHQSQ